MYVCKIGGEFVMNKPKLIFVVRWDKDKKKTWSGTTYALFEELNK